jgi:DNA recombination protein RmuC
MVEALLIVLVVLAVVGLVLIILLLRKGPADLSPVLARLDNLERSQDKVATAVRDELSRGRSESAEASRLLRQEVGDSAKGTLDSLVRGLADLGDQQGKRLDAFAEQLSKATEASQADARLLREENAKSIQNLSASTLAQTKLNAEAQQERLTGFAEKLDLLATTVDARLKDGQAASEKQIGEMRSDATTQAARLKDGTNEALGNFREQVVQRLDAGASLQQQQLESFGKKLTALSEELQKSDASLKETVDKQLSEIQQSLEKRLSEVRVEGKQASDTARGEITKALKEYQEALRLQVTEASGSQRTQMNDFLARLNTVAENIEKRMDALRNGVEQKLKDIQEDSTKKLDQMRQTVDEKLQGTLEKRLGESFKLVSDRLELVHKGLGEMQTLASGVGDLKKVLTNVKTRGTWGEVQLGNLLDQMLTRDQFQQNVATKPGSGERVEYAIRLPGRTGDGDSPVWLPIDSKCPQEDYQRLVEAAERGDAEAVKESSKQLEIRIKACARDISQKYISPPNTTDFAILFVPTEGLFAEVLRCAGLTEYLQNEYRVMVAGPTTLAALLNSLRMGFRTLAIEKRSSEVWNVLSAVKTEFGQFAEVFEKVKKKLGEAANTIDQAAVRTRAMKRTLKTVDELPAPDASSLLGLVASSPAVESEEETPE